MHIPVSFRPIGDLSVLTVTGRDLSVALIESRSLHRWLVPRLHGFVEGVDYSRFYPDEPQGNRGTLAVEYALTMRCAAEVSRRMRTVTGMDVADHLLLQERA